MNSARYEVIASSGVSSAISSPPINPMSADDLDLVQALDRVEERADVLVDARVRDPVEARRPQRAAQPLHDIGVELEAGRPVRHRWRSPAVEAGFASWPAAGGVLPGKAAA